MIKFSPEMKYILGFSKEEAERLHNDSVTPIHLLLGMLRHEGNMAKEALEQMVPDIRTLKQELEYIAQRHQVLVSPSPADMALNMESNRILRICVLEARLRNSDTIEPIHVLLAMLRFDDTDAFSVLDKMNISYEGLVSKLRFGSGEDGQEVALHDEVDEDEEDGDDVQYTSKSNDAGKTTTSRQGKKPNSKTPVLDGFGTDLTKAAEQGLLDPVVGREREMERMTQILCRRKKNNPILIGEPGVGKSAIVEGLATRIVRHRTSRLLWNKRIVTLDMANVVAGTKYRGQFEERIRNIINELKDNPDVILFIDEIHTIIGAGNAQGTMDAANMLKPALSRGEFQCIGATTTDEFRKTIEKDGALERRFQKILVEPTSTEDTLQILHNLRERYEEHHNVQYTDDAIRACVDLTGRYVTNRAFPDKAIDAMDEAGSRISNQEIPLPREIADLQTRLQELHKTKSEAVGSQNFELAADCRDQIRLSERLLDEAQKKFESTMNDTPKAVSDMDVAHVVSLMTGIPVQRTTSKENQMLRDLASTLRRKVVGQDEAIGKLVRAIQRSRLGLKDPNKPIGTFLFVGPTGVGKTYLTKCLAEELFGTRDSIIRIDMSEYMEKHTVSRMVGAPPGYVGYEEGGQLTERVRRKPYSIVLLDEIEKAHPDVFNVLLQVMDEGRLTDGNGATVDFKNTVVIMTSNCGTKQIRDFGNGMGFRVSEGSEADKKASRDIVAKALKKQFAPEFLNRLDDVIYFDQLDLQSIQGIVDIELRPLLERIHGMGHQLSIDDDAKNILCKKGYDAQYGARPLKRAIQTMLEDPLCDLLLSGDSNRTLAAKVENGEIVITDLVAGK